MLLDDVENSSKAMDGRIYIMLEYVVGALHVFQQMFYPSSKNARRRRKMEAIGGRNYVVSGWVGINVKIKRDHTSFVLRTTPQRHPRRIQVLAPFFLAGGGLDLKAKDARDIELPSGDLEAKVLREPDRRTRLCRVGVYGR